MEFNFNIPSVIMLVSGAILLSFVIFVIRQKNDKSSFYLKLMMAAAALWAVANGLELALNDIGLKVFLSKFSYIGVCAIVPLWLMFVLNYVKHPLLEKRGLYPVISVMPAIMLGFAFTNEFHGLVWPSLETIVADGGIRIIYGHGIMVLVFAVYSAVMILYGLFILIGSMNTTSILIRRQMLLVIAASVAPWVCNVVYLLGKSPIKGVDLTPIGFIITGVMFHFGVLQFKMLDLMPVARYILFREVSDGVLIIDEKHRITDINPASSEILGIDEKQILGKRAEEVIPDSTDLLAKTWDDDRIRNVCFRLDGKYIDVRISRMSDKNRSFGFLAVLRDVSGMRKAQMELIRAQEEAEAANNAKGRFLANVSHEIKTPMKGIMGFLELLSETGLDPVQTEYVNETKSAANTLLCLLNDILDYTKAESGMLQLEHIPMDLHLLVRETISLFEAAARKNGNRLEYTIAQSVPDRIYGDPVRLRQVLNNLIGNAVKFTENGSITVRLDTFRDAGNRDMLRFEVSDTGVGMSSEAIDRIFQAFTQADASMTRKFGGTGLGLSIVEKIVVLWGGAIEVQSEPGKGSCFTVTIRLEPAESTMDDFACAQPELPDTGAISEQSAAGIASKQEHGFDKEESTVACGKGSILLVDDIEANRKLVSILLKKQGYEVDCADNGKRAVEMCGSKIYDLVLMDCQMPEMDGYQAAREIRSGNGRNKGTPIVAMTAYNSEAYRRYCKASGMDDHIAKPIRVDVLKEITTRYIDHNSVAR